MYPFLLYFCILFLSLKFFLTFNPITERHSWRQADTISIARNFTQDPNILKPRNMYDLSSFREKGDFINGEFQLYTYCVFLLYSLLSVFFSVSILWTGKLLSFIFYIFGAIYLFKLMTLIQDKMAGLGSLYLYTFSLASTYYLSITIPDALVVSLLLAYLYYLFYYWKYQKVTHLCILSILMTCFSLIRPNFLLFLLPTIYLFYKGNSSFYKNKKYYLFLLFPLSAVILFYSRYYLLQLEGYLTFGGGSSAFTSSISDIFDWTYFRRVFISRLPETYLNFTGLLFVFIGIYKNMPSTRFFLPIYLLIFFSNLIFFHGHNKEHEYYQLFFFPYLLITFGLGFSFLFQSRVSWIKKGSIFLLLVLFLVSFSFIPTFKKKSPLLQAGLYLKNQNQNPTDKVLYDYNPNPLLLYYSHLRGRFITPSILNNLDDFIKKHHYSYFVFPENKLSYYESLGISYEKITCENNYCVFFLNSKSLENEPNSDTSSSP